MAYLISRRDLLAATGGLVLLRQARWSIVADGTITGEMRKGAELGIAEAGQMARLLGQSIELVADSPGATGSVAGFITRTRDPEGHVTPVVTLEPGASRHACVFSVAASEARKAAALQQWASTEAGPGDRAGLTVLEWHPSLKRFGASEVNERFVAQHGTPMTSAAWLGWIAVKALAEAAMRREAPAEACDGFRRLRFDGHKGVPLRFDPDTRELRQPLYIVERTATGEKVLGEVHP
jgi:hypothetical protein